MIRAGTRGFCRIFCFACGFAPPTLVSVVFPQFFGEILRNPAGSSRPCCIQLPPKWHFGNSESGRGGGIFFCIPPGRGIFAPCPRAAFQ